MIGLSKTGGIFKLAADLPQKFQVFHSPTHELFPFTGVFTSFLSVGIWYNCTSQHIVQRCLGAKDEWNARVGVVTAGFLHIILPFFFVLPGIIAFKLYPNLERPDHAYILLVKTLVPPGLRGLILAAIAAALMSHLSSMINSTSTILTMDLYKRLWKPDAGEKNLVAFGQWSGGVVMALGIAIAMRLVSSVERTASGVLVAYLVDPAGEFGWSRSVMELASSFVPDCAAKSTLGVGRNCTRTSLALSGRHFPVRK